MRSRRLFLLLVFRSNCLPEERLRHPNRQMFRAEQEYKAEVRVAEEPKETEQEATSTDFRRE
jgi:hypothetical protein